MIAEEKALEWYSSLPIHTKINAKICFEILTSIKLEDLSFLLSYRERVIILYNKLKKEGFEV